MNRKIGFLAVVSSLAMGSLLLLAPQSGYSTEQGGQRRDARDLRQDGRQEARDTKQECREGDEKSRAECRQDKRNTKQDTREQARDIKY
jgi:hypothetical protein